MARPDFAPGVVVTITQVGRAGETVRSEQIEWGGETATQGAIVSGTFEALVDTTRNWFASRGRATT